MKQMWGLWLCVATVLTLPNVAPAQTWSVEAVSSPPHLVTTPGVLVRVRGMGANPVGWASNDTLMTPFYQNEDGDWFGWIGLMDLLLPDSEQILFVMPDWRSPTAAVQLRVAVHAPDQPLFSGPRPPPAPCQNQALGFKPADDETTCTVPLAHAYVYRGTDGMWRRFPQGAVRPDNVDRTTTSSGRNVPMIVLVEAGVINRSPYAIAILDDPATSPDMLPGKPWPRTAWNGHLVYGAGSAFGLGVQSPTHAGFFDLSKAADTASCVEALLSQGYAVAASHAAIGPVAYDAVAAETLLRVRERFIKRYALPLSTVGIGTGDAGMALARIAATYPGLDAIGPERDTALTVAAQSCR